MGTAGVLLKSYNNIPGVGGGDPLCPTFTPVFTLLAVPI